MKPLIVFGTCLAVALVGLALWMQSAPAPRSCYLQPIEPSEATLGEPLLARHTMEVTVASETDGARHTVQRGVLGGHDPVAFKRLVADYKKHEHEPELVTAVLMQSIAILLDQQGRSSTPPSDGVAVTRQSEGATGQAFIYRDRMYQFSSSEFPEFGEWAEYRVIQATNQMYFPESLTGTYGRIRVRVNEALAVLCPSPSTAVRTPNAAGR